jgi:hypothetical protein
MKVSIFKSELGCVGCTVDASDLPKTESVLTMVGGKIVYNAKVIPHQ